MKNVLAAILLAASLPSHAQCNPVGWLLVGQRIISPSETVCTYEKNGARMSIMASGICPLNPC